MKIFSSSKSIFSPGKNHRRDFTLIEILVAVAILVIMMGFLMHFVSGAQRIWQSSENTTNVFQRVQIAFRMLESDLQNSLFNQTPGEELPLYRYVKRDGNQMQEVILGMVTAMPPAYGTSLSENEKIGYTTVFYQFNRQERKLFRLSLEGLDSKALECYGNSDSICLNTLVNTADAPYKDLNTWDEFLDGVLEFNIEVPAGAQSTNGVNYWTTRPKAVKISMTLYDPMALPGNFESLSDEDQELAIKKICRAFTKILFLP